MKWMQLTIGMLAMSMACAALAQPATTPVATTQPYRVLTVKKVGGAGRWDYLTVDPTLRRLYITRQTRVDVYDADTLDKVGEIPNTPGVHGVALAIDTGQGFTSNGKGPSVTLFDLKTLKTLKTIQVQGKPDNILYEPASQHVWVFSHTSPNLQVLSASSGQVIKSEDLGGEPEESVSDGMGHVYVNLESTSEIVALDAMSYEIVGRWKLAPGEGPTGLALDALNRRLFSACAGNAKLVILDAGDGTKIGTLSTGAHADAATFNPATSEAFTSNGDGTLTIVKENSATSFAVEQTLPTLFGARTCALDARTGRIFLITAEFPKETPKDQERPTPLPDTFTIIVVGK